MSVTIEISPTCDVCVTAYCATADERVLVFHPGRGALSAQDGGAPLTTEALRRLAECACAAVVDLHDVPPERSVVLLPAVFLERVLADARTAQETLTGVQARCTALIEERRVLRAQLSAHAAAQAAYQAERDEARLALAEALERFALVPAET